MASAGKSSGKDGAELSLDAEEFSSDFFRIYLFKGARPPARPPLGRLHILERRPGLAN